MVARPFELASLTIGVINPVGVATAIDISAFLYLFVAFQLLYASIHVGGLTVE
jgi:hypothetical protein